MKYPTTQGFFKSLFFPLEVRFFMSSKTVTVSFSSSVENHQSLNISYFIMMTTEDENETVTVLEDIKKRTSKGKKSDLKKPCVVGYFK